MILSSLRKFYFSCSYDHLKITSDNNIDIGKYCGELTGKEVVVSGDYAVLTFHSDFSVQKGGFRILFTAVQLSKYMGKRLGQSRLRLNRTFRYKRPNPSQFNASVALLNLRTRRLYPLRRCISYKQVL